MSIETCRWRKECQKHIDQRRRLQYFTLFNFTRLFSSCEIPSISTTACVSSPRSECWPDIFLEVPRATPELTSTCIKREIIYIIRYRPFFGWGRGERLWRAANNVHRERWKFQLLFIGWSALLEQRLWWWINRRPHGPRIVGAVGAKSSINYTIWAARNLLILALVKVVIVAIIGLW